MSRTRQIWTLFVLCASVGVVMMTLTSLYTAGPDLTRALHASQTQLTWIIDIYTVAITGLLLPAGALGDRFGRKGVMIAGCVVFLCAAVVLQFVKTPSGVIAVRAVLGVGGALIMPATLSLITSTFPPSFRDTGVGIWTASFTLAGGLGVVGTGLLLEFFSWRCSFWVVLVGAIFMLVCSFTLPTSREKQPPPIDPVGSLIAVVAITSLVFGLIESGLKGWSSPVIIGTLSLGVAACAVFSLLQLRTRDPLLDVRLFRIRPFGVSALTVTVAFAGLYGSFFMGMEYLQFVLGKSALMAGLAVASMALTVVPMALLLGRIARRFSLRTLITTGLLLMGGGYAMCLLASAHTPYLASYLPYVPMGIGVGLNMVPCTSAIIDNVARHKQGVAAAVNHTTREMGTALGVALIGGVLTSAYTSRIVGITSHLPPAARGASRQSVAGALAVAAKLGHAGRPLAAAAHHAFVHAVHQTGLVMIGVMGATAVVAALWAPRPEPRRRAAPVSRPRPRLLTLRRRRPVPAASSRTFALSGAHPGGMFPVSGAHPGETSLPATVTAHRSVTERTEPINVTQPTQPTRAAAASPLPNSTARWSTDAGQLRSERDEPVRNEPRVQPASGESDERLAQLSPPERRPLIPDQAWPHIGLALSLAATAHLVRALARLKDS
jgi:EmrB/QacA subfamily drug resistance transporter